MSDKPNEPTLESLLAAIKARCDAASKGWTRKGDHPVDDYWATMSPDDLTFVIASRTDVPRLLELVEYYRNRACLAAPSPTAVVMMDCHGSRILSGEEEG